jgi:hypothetical protein
MLYFIATLIFVLVVVADAPNPTNACVRSCFIGVVMAAIAVILSTSMNVSSPTSPIGPVACGVLVGYIVYLVRFIR